MYDSILVNTPVSSPLHAQLNLPLLKGYLAEHGFKSLVIDSNVEFFREFLSDSVRPVTREQAEENPISLLGYYNDIERVLLEKSRAFEGLHVGLRSLAMLHDRLFFQSVVASVRDEKSNPFVAFYERLVKERIARSGAKIVGIAITFQDQIIPTYTLAAQLRKHCPDIKIVLGGQIVTRCYSDMMSDGAIMSYCDYLALWDGELPLLNIHKAVIRGENLDLTNVIEAATGQGRADRHIGDVAAAVIPQPDFSDIPFDAYLFPEYLVPLQTTRGCYAQCEFCAIPFGSNRYKVRDAEKVLNDILAVQELTERKFGHKATFFKFMEDTSAPSMLFELAKLIEQRGIDAKWETFARLEKAFARPGMMEQLFRGGCRKIHWGLETNDPDILKTMNKKVEESFTDEVLKLSGEAGILNFCFVLLGFPGETEAQRQNLVDYIVGNRHIHTITIATFDVTRNSPMHLRFKPENPFGIDVAQPSDFQVRLPYTVNGESWKTQIIPAAHRAMIDIVRNRPDIGFVTLFPDQLRAMLCDKYGNDWGSKFVQRYGEENIREMLLNTQAYVRSYEAKQEIDVATLPEPLKREHFRTKEDLALLAKAVLRRRDYEDRRIQQV